MASGVPFELITNLTSLNTSLLECKVCDLIMFNPARCGLCHNHMCSEEYKKGIEEGECPICNQAITRKTMRKAQQGVTDEYGKAIQKCRFNESHTGTIKIMHSHEGKCESNPN